MTSKMKAVLEAIKPRKSGVSIAKAMGITPSQLTKLSDKRDDQIDMGVVRKFCSAAPIDLHVFIELDAEDLRNLLSETHYFPQLAHCISTNGSMSILEECLFGKYVMFNVSLSDPSYVLVSEIVIGDANGIGFRYSQIFPDHDNHVIRGSGHLMRSGEALYFIGEYDNPAHYPYVMILQTPARGRYDWLEGVGASVTTEKASIPGACRLIAVGLDPSGELPHQLGRFPRAKISNREVREQLYLGGYGSLMSAFGAEQFRRGGQRRSKGRAPRKA